MRARLPRPGRFPRQDRAGIVLVTAITAATIAFRQLTIVPRAFVGMCAVPDAPLVCLPRQAVLWAQYEGWFGMSALALGIVGFIAPHRALGIAALAAGIAATVNYNGTEGIIGASLGLWAWLDAATQGRARASFFEKKEAKKL